MDTGPRIDSYQWAGGRETMLRWGPADGPVVVAALPLLEEANRARAFVVAILRALAERGIGGVLPDLPGQGESLVPTAEMSLADLRAAFAAVVERQGEQPVFALSTRSGALLIGAAAVRGEWSLAPQTGAEVLKEWRRIAPGALEGEQVKIAGNLVARSLLDEVDCLPVQPRGGGGGLARTVRLATDPHDADLKVDGVPLWRRAEPDNDLAFAQRLAADVTDWIVTCGA